MDIDISRINSHKNPHMLDFDEWMKNNINMTLWS